MKEIPVYVLITPARNEAQLIESTIQSVVNQTVLPLKWVIVSDGSTDGTDDIVRKYLPVHSFIELVRTPERADRHFGGKARAFNTGLEKLHGLTFDVVGNLDADLTLSADHFEYLVAKFADNPKLGVAGTPFREGNEQYDYRFTSIDHVSGACQLFRRECFDQIGGYVPIPGGGIDLVAVTTARMKGWQTRTFTDRVCMHHRKMNTAIDSGLALKFKWGQKDYRLGNHPAWQVVRCIYQMKNKPYVVGGLLVLSGYYWSLFARQPRVIEPELVHFRGQEQIARMRSLVGLR